MNPFADLVKVAVGWSRVSGSPGIQQALENHPKPTVCLATAKGAEYAMYKCNRLVLGAQGLQESELEVFISGHLCQVGSDALAKLPVATLTDLQIVISDSERLSTADDCQSRGWSGPRTVDDPIYLTGWTSALPWGLIDVYSLKEGTRVEPNFDYLKGHTEYSSTDLKVMSRRLTATP